MDLMVIMGIVVIYWYVVDSIGGMLNPIGQMPKTHYKCVKRNFVMVLLEKANAL